MNGFELQKLLMKAEAEMFQSFKLLLLLINHSLKFATLHSTNIQESIIKNRIGQYSVFVSSVFLLSCFLLLCCLYFIYCLAGCFSVLVFVIVSCLVTLV